MKNANSLPSSSVEDQQKEQHLVIPSELSDEAQLKLEVIQALLEPCGLALRVPSAARYLWSKTPRSSRKTR